MAPTVVPARLEILRPTGPRNLLPVKRPRLYKYPVGVYSVHVGLLKKEFLGYSRTPAEIALMKAMKRALDPANLMNPGKVFDL